MALHLEQEIFKELISLAADHFGYEQSHIEKDYWVCKILNDIASSEYKGNVFFKGGTSLSKGYGLIERFSEDLDLFVFTGDKKASKQAEKTLNRKLSKFIIENNYEIYREELSIAGGNYRKLFFSYNNVYNAIGLKENLEVEIKSCDLSDKELMYYPAEMRMIRSIISTFLESVQRHDLVREYELESFLIQCLSPKKTICDKISRLVKLSYDDDAANLLAKHIRDIYDLSLLLSTPQYQEYLHSDEFLRAMYSVTEEDGFNNKSKSHLSLADAVIFRMSKEMMAVPAIKRAYLTDLRKLVFNKQKMPPIEVAVNSLEGLYQVLIKFEKYRGTI